MRDRASAAGHRPAASPCTVIVLGAGGYLGGEIALRFHGRQGFHVVGVCRRPERPENCDTTVVRDVFRTDIRDLVPPHGRVVLVNAAFDFGAVGRGRADTRYAALEAAVREVMARPGCMCINISSMSAFPGCRSDYGREKLFVESLFAKHRAVNLRPGLVVSTERPGTAFKRLITLVERCPVVPVLTAHDDGFFICELDILLDGIETLAEMRLNKPHTLSFCYGRRMRLVDILRLIESRLHRRRLKIPIPWWAAYWALRAKERITGVEKIRADSITDFAFPAVTAPSRHLYAALAAARRRDSAATDEFSSLEASRRVRAPGGAAAGHARGSSR